ncbi:MAG: hypothetical protein ACK5U7_14075 [Bacteroidota bacterium]|jgi:hypothetical protein
MPTSKQSISPRNRPAAPVANIDADEVIVYVLGDLHFSINPPSGRNDTYAKDLVSVLKFVAEQVSKEHAASGQYPIVCCVGDWFHRKGASCAEAIALMQLLRPIVKMTGPILGIDGNHDQFAGDPSTSRLSQAFGVLLQSGLVRDAELDPARIKVGNTAVGIIGAGYKTSHGMAVSAMERSAAACMKHGVATFVVGLSHADAYIATTEAHELVVASHGGMLARSSVVCNGHLHDQTGSGKVDYADKFGAGRGLFLQVGTSIIVGKGEDHHSPTMTRLCIIGEKCRVSRIALPRTESSLAFAEEKEQAAPLDEMEINEIVRQIREQTIGGDSPVTLLDSIATTMSKSGSDAHRRAKKIISECA